MRVLVVAPHPDDESIGMGGAILKHVAAGDDVYVAFLTSGELGIPGTPPEEVAAIREAEALAACNLLEAGSYGFMRFPDGDLAAHVEDAIDRIKALIETYRPDRIYTTHAGEDHVDHRAAAKIVGTAVKEFQDENDLTIDAFGFEVWTPIARPSLFVDGFDGGIKRHAISLHVSQDGRNHFGEAILALNRYRAIMNNRWEQYAEAFVRLEGAKMQVTILLLTYAPTLDHPRAEYARRTLGAALSNLVPGPDVSLRLHIADDGSPYGHVAGLESYARGLMPDLPITTSISVRGGYGNSYNLACQAIHGVSDFVLALEDDWQLQRPLELTPLVRALMESYERMATRPNDWIRCIRLGYLGFERELRGHLVEFAGQKFFRFDPDSPEQYLFAGHARLETVEFERDVGPWTPGIGAGAVELDIIGRPAARLGIAWPLDLVHTSGDLFAHIGDASVNAVQPEGVA